MILTTNRVTVFDEAVQSRIHLGIKYDQLSKKAKAEIWTAFIAQANKVSTTGEGEKLSPKHLDELSRKEFNGRQVTSSTHFEEPSSLIIECRSRTRSAWPTLSRQLRVSRLGTTTSWRQLKRMRTSTMISEEQGRRRARRHICRHISTYLALSIVSHEKENFMSRGANLSFLIVKSRAWIVASTYKMSIKCQRIHDAAHGLHTGRSSAFHPSDCKRTRPYSVHWTISITRWHPPSRPYASPQPKHQSFVSPNAKLLRCPSQTPHFLPPLPSS